MSLPSEQEASGTTDDAGIDIRLLRVPGRADLALLVVTWPAVTRQAQATLLEELVPRLEQFARAGDVSEVLVVLRAGGDAGAQVPADAPLPALDRIVDQTIVPVTMVLDGPTGAPVEEVASRAARVVRGGVPLSLVQLDTRPPRVETRLTGTALVDAMVASVREGTDASELVARRPVPVAP